MIITAIVLCLVIVILVLCAIPVMIVETAGWAVILSAFMAIITVIYAIVEFIRWPFRAFNKYIIHKKKR